MLIIVAGTSRSGKTTVAKRLCRARNISYWPFDSIISTLENLYPETGLRHYDHNAELSPKLAAFIGEFSKHLAYEDVDGVIDLYQLFPVDYKRVLDAYGIPIIYLGYPGLSAEEKLRDVKLHQRTVDWTNDVGDMELLVILNQFIAESRMMAEQCKTYKLPFFDTGEAFEENIEKAVSYLLGSKR